MKSMNQLLEQIELGESKSFGQLSVIPIFSSAEPKLSYVTLPEVLGGRKLRISELEGGASVRELSVINEGRDWVLLVDGEELIGALQNRVLNTTIIVHPMSRLSIPVSCTEHGRWSYKSRDFADSGVVMPFRTRYNKKLSVDSELGSSGTYRSNQSRVWEDISQMSLIADETSPTGAMRDVYESRMSSLEQYTDALKPVPGQKGMAVLIGGEVAGMEIFSRESAFRSLAPKLIKSYAMDVVLEGLSGSSAPAPEVAKAFADDLAGLPSKRYESAGAGWDYRFTGDRVTGSALSYRNEVIYASFYNKRLAMKFNRSYRSALQPS